MKTEKKPSNPSAYPNTTVNANGVIISKNYGMTLRDHFAGLAMQAIISNSDTMRELTKAYERGKKTDSFESCLADMSFGFSDAMLKQREQ